MFGERYLLWLQNLRSVSPQWVSGVFYFISDVTLLVPYFAIFWLYCCKNKDSAMKLLFSYILGIWIGNLLKVVFCVPRPFVLWPAIQPYSKALAAATGYSFPSGHTTVAGVLYGFLAMTYGKKNKWLTSARVLVTLTVAFSRNWLGVHTLLDVLVGLIIALPSLYLGLRLAECTLGDPKDRRRALVLVVALVVISCVFALFRKAEKIYSQDGTLIADPKMLKSDLYIVPGTLCAAFVALFLDEKFIHFCPGRTREERVVCLAFDLLISAGSLILVRTLGPRYIANRYISQFVLGFVPIVQGVCLFPWLWTYVRTFVPKWSDKNSETTLV